MCIMVIGYGLALDVVVLYALGDYDNCIITEVAVKPFSDCQRVSCSSEEAEAGEELVFVVVVEPGRRRRFR